MVMEFTSIFMGKFLREILRMERGTVKAYSNMPMILIIKEILKMIMLMVLVK